MSPKCHKAQASREQKRLVNQAKIELAAGKKEKAQAIKGWDRHLQKRKAPIERLEKDLREMKKKTGELEKVTN